MGYLMELGRETNWTIIELRGCRELWNTFDMAMHFCN